MSKAKTACVSAAFVMAASAVLAQQAPVTAAQPEKPAPQWEFHGCAAMPISPDAARSEADKPALNLALKLQEDAKKR